MVSCRLRVPVVENREVYRHPYPSGGAKQEEMAETEKGSGLAKVESGMHEAKHGRRGGSHWNDFSMNRWGSANAKRNMWRGHK